MAYTDLIYLGITIVSILFSVYIYFRDPQEKLDKRQALDNKDVESKASILAQQLQWYKEESERRFKELTEGLTGAGLRADNHIHTIDVKMDFLTGKINSLELSMTTKMTELATIINERMPKK